MSRCLALALVAGCLAAGAAGCLAPAPSTASRLHVGDGGVPLRWTSPVAVQYDGLAAGAHFVGYEPGLAVDDAGTLAITAHKAVAQPTYGSGAASFLAVSTDNGTTWHEPGGSGPLAAAQDEYRLAPALEGDVAFDARGWLYFADTYLGDATLQAWSDRGSTLQYAKPLASTGYDDRPWLAAQGAGIVHYTGLCCFPAGSPPTGLPTMQYCRSTDAGLTFTCSLLPGGSDSLAADRHGRDVDIVYEGNAGPSTDLLVLASHDQGATWNAPVVAAHRANAPGAARFPMSAVDAQGNAAFVWQQEDPDYRNGTHVYVTATQDQGATWSTQEVTPFRGGFAMPTIGRDAAGDTAVAFYGTPDVPVSAASRWFLYVGESRSGGWAIAQADERPLYVGSAADDAFHDLFKLVVEPGGIVDVAYVSTVIVPLPVPDGSIVGATPQVWFVRGVPA